MHFHTPKIVFLLVVLALVTLPGCLITIQNIVAPEAVTMQQEFCIVCDAVLDGTSAGSAGALVQVPESFKITRAYVVTSGGTYALKRNTILEETVPREKGFSVIALTGTIDYAPVQSDSIRLLMYFEGSEPGTYPVKFIFGIPALDEHRTNWRSVSPEGVYKFSAINDTMNTQNLRSITISKPEVNGTAAISFSGERQFVAFPDTGFLAFAPDADFTLEFWVRTTDRYSAIASTRTDDFATYYPFEIWIDARGDVQITSGDGTQVASTVSHACISDGRWHHVAASYSSVNSYMRLLVDAVTVDSIPVVAPSHATTPVPLILAGRATKSYFFKGEIDEFRLWSVARGDEETAFYQNAVLSGFEDDLYLLLNFEQSNGGILENTNPSVPVQAIAFNNPKLVMSTAPLLAEVISFSAYLDEADEHSVILSWESFEDSDVKGYEVEKRTERGKFSVYERTVPDSAGGNHQVYRFSDSYNGRNVYYYRLRRINKDGSVFYSEVYPIGAEAYYNFVLEDNKPDPFVSGTEIAFTLNESAYVTLIVYDIMGQEVEKLVAERKAAGTYTIPFDGSDKPAGMYFYKLKTNAGSQTKKMYLSK